MAVLNFTSTEFREQQAHVFELADRGEKVIIRRKDKQAYTLVPFDDDEPVITPELEERLDRAREEYKRGETLHFENIEAMNAWLESL